jgi:hypothetical protein
MPTDPSRTPAEEARIRAKIKADAAAAKAAKAAPAEKASPSLTSRAMDAVESFLRSGTAKEKPASSRPAPRQLGGVTNSRDMQDYEDEVVAGRKRNGQSTDNANGYN